VKFPFAFQGYAILLFQEHDHSFQMKQSFSISPMPLSAMRAGGFSVGAKGGDVAKVQRCLQVTVVQEFLVLAFPSLSSAKPPKALNARGHKGASRIGAGLLSDLGAANAAGHGILLPLGLVSAEGAGLSTPIRQDHPPQKELLEAAESVRRPSWGILTVTKDGKVTVEHAPEKLNPAFRDVTLTNCLIKLK
jgi:hypothetical protein